MITTLNPAQKAWQTMDKLLKDLSPRTKVTIQSALTVVVGLWVLWHIQMPAAMLARLAPPLWPF
jgi:hypothetical protein